MSKGWYSRGYLPHFDEPGLVQLVTFRLADSMPQERRGEWQALLDSEDDPRKRRKVEEYLDAGHGSCCLSRPEAARIVEDVLLYQDGRQYRLFAWVVMPNHVHAILELLKGSALGRVVQGRKSHAARRVNRLLGRTGRLWQPDYYDRFIRDQEHLETAALYIHYNPVKAGLTSRPSAWPYGSARFLGSL